MISATAIDKHVEQLFAVMKRIHAALTKAGVEYRIVGGMAVFFQVSERDPNAARFTRDVDIAVARRDLQRITEAAEEFGFRYRHAAGLDILVDAEQPKARSAVHLLFTGEKVKPDSVEPVPDFSTAPTITQEGILLAPVADLLRMKLTSFRLKDKTHVVDLDSVGLITPEVEQTLPETLRLRLKQVREEEAQSGSVE
jgi:hypothetical protein